ncbi:S-adenosyl-L-methionine-dependent methyltransferase [Rhizodiscina lignyota]|uniref:S-adenosyl-L-methionine-dependent methyltransferase n=1 Tax=Rhizodiscina lignyota TaxID=1504668 RepID=A0A9P4M5E3_9PEZI|nr:S-adenosyl-L-methionine-dependent methyltransferase [Rhizodiscina lignyota]
MDAAAKEKQREKARLHFLDAEPSVLTKKWDELYLDGSCLPWDRGQPSPALVDAINDRKDVLGAAVMADQGGPSGAVSRRKRAFVPGCGKGYDALLLASFGYDVCGLDASETVIRKCKENAEQSADKPEYAVRDAQTGKGSVTFIYGDFFSNDWFGNITGGIGHGFDLIFDYTFLCALPLALRPKWARRMSELLSPEDGHLICLEYPTTKAPSTGGPPWCLPPLVYEELLARPGEEISYNEEGWVTKSSSLKPSSDALIKIAHWQPERTHPAGQGTDWMSIWRHQ